MFRKIVVLCLLVSICAFGSVSTVASAKAESLSKEEIIKAFLGKQSRDTTTINNFILSDFTVKTER